MIIKMFRFGSAILDLPIFERTPRVLRSPKCLGLGYQTYLKSVIYETTYNIMGLLSRIDVFVHHKNSN